MDNAPSRQSFGLAYYSALLNADLPAETVRVAACLLSLVCQRNGVQYVSETGIAARCKMTGTNLKGRVRQHIQLLAKRGFFGAELTNSATNVLRRQFLKHVDCPAMPEREPEGPLGILPPVPILYPEFYYDGPLEDCADELSQKPKTRTDVSLKALPYDEYLQTEHWDKMRKAAYKRADHRCQLCNSNGKMYAHHRTYENRGHEKPGDLIVLCEHCHAKHHDKLPCQEASVSDTDTEK